MEADSRLEHFPEADESVSELFSELSRESLFTEPLGEDSLFLVPSESYPLSSDLVFENFRLVFMLLLVGATENKNNCQHELLFINMNYFKVRNFGCAVCMLHKYF